MADGRKITIDIEAKDYASSVFRSVTTGVGNFAVGANNGIIRVNNALRTYNNTMRGFNSTVARSLVDAGKAIYGFTTDAIKQFAELERQHARTMGAMANDYNISYSGVNNGYMLNEMRSDNAQRFRADSEALKRQAITYGTAGPTGGGSLYNAVDVSSAQTALVKAGVNPNDILTTDALASIMKFAGGNELGIDTATEFAVQLGTQFRIDPSEWGGMLDQVTYAANKSIIDVEDIIESMKYAGNMAAGFDQPLSDILTALAVMGNSGLKGSQAGTGVQAIFTRGMSPSGITNAGLPPTENVEEIYNGFREKVIDENGMFLGLGNFTEHLAGIMNSLSDEELSWFNKKLFGMFQQKAALALGRTDDDGSTVFDDMSNMITNYSGGSNDVIYDLALAASSGQLDSVANAYSGFKMDVGDSLAPVTKEVSKQLRDALVTGNFDFNFDSVRKALKESAASIDEKYGSEIARATEGVGDFILDLIQVGQANVPLGTGTANGVIQLLNGDFQGAWDTFSGSISDVNENIDGLPDDLQETATAIRNLILIFEGLFALNIVARMSEGVTSIVRLLTGNRIIAAHTKVTSATTSVTGANATVNATTVMLNGGSITSATFGSVTNATIASMMAKTTSMTVYATNVTVIGGSGLGGSGVGGVPTGPLVLGGGSGAAMAIGASAATSAALPSAAATAALPGAVGATAAGAAVGKAAQTLFFNPLTGTYMTMAQMAKGTVSAAMKHAPIIGSLAALSTVPSSRSQSELAYKSGLGDFRNGIVDNDQVTSIPEFFYELHRPNGGTTYKEKAKIKDIQSATPDEYRQTLDTLLQAFGSYETGKSYVSGMMDRWYYDNSSKGPVSEDEYMVVASRLVSAMAEYISGNNITDLGVYADQVPGANTGIYNDILTGKLEQLSVSSISLSEAVNTLVSSPMFRASLGKGPMSENGAYGYIMGQLGGGANGMTANQSLLESINQGIATLDPTLRVDIKNPSPVVNVDVKVNVDKQGNVTKNVIRNYNDVDSWIYQQSQRYGGVTRIER